RGYRVGIVGRVTRSERREVRPRGAARRGLEAVAAVALGGRDDRAVVARDDVAVHRERTGSGEFAASDAREGCAGLVAGRFGTELSRVVTSAREHGGAEAQARAR